MIHVVATITVRPGCREQYLDAFRQLIPAVKAEAGCREYLPTLDIDSGFRS